MKRFAGALFLILVGIGNGIAQQRFNIGGSIIDPSGVTAMDMFNFSQQTHTFGTARSAGMAGAMTSLGGDLSSLAINPAGLGMYRTNEVAVTPMIGVARSINGDPSYQKNNSTRFSMSNFGVVFKAYEGSGNVVAVNVAFGYNRLADFNYRTSFYRPDNQSSIAGVFARQLQQSGMISDQFYDSNDNFDWWRLDPKYWGAALGYRCGLVYDKVPDGAGGEIQSDWHPDMYGTAPSVDQYMSLHSKGAIGEYAFSTGMNINNKLYIGLTLGVQSIYRQQAIYYGEEYTYAPGDAPSGMELRYFNYNQKAIIDGSGVNLKLGITYRPIRNLRLGVAFHTPTAYTLEYAYQGAMTSRVRDNATGKFVLPDPEAMTEVWRDNGPNSWHFSSPSRLLFGASYTFGDKALISVDYERAWYNGIRTQKTPVGRGVYNEFFPEYFKGSNTVRVGAEVKVLPILALRAGYGFNGSMLKDKTILYSSPIIDQTQYATAGVGISFGFMFIDVAYQYVAARQTDYRLFYAIDTVGEEDSAGNTVYSDDYSGLFSTKLTRHNVIMTLGFRF
ncbi:MAG: long-chain fatty acid transporter [Rikenellaceae bacterium]|nr:long-chain fatty acid transporter [Rikenellaceae bacterium]